VLERLWENILVIYGHPPDATPWTGFRRWTKNFGEMRLGLPAMDNLYYMRFSKFLGQRRRGGGGHRRGWEVLDATPWTGFRGWTKNLS